MWNVEFITKFKKACTAAIILSAFLRTNSFAQTLADAHKAYVAGNWEEAAKAYEAFRATALSRTPEGRIMANEYLTAAGSFSWPVFFSAWGIGTFYAVTDEIHQLFSPGRSCEFRDMCIDCAGVLTGILLIILLRKRGRHTPSDGNR